MGNEVSIYQYSRKLSKALFYEQLYPELFRKKNDNELMITEEIRVNHKRRGSKSVKSRRGSSNSKSRRGTDSKSRKSRKRVESMKKMMSEIAEEESDGDQELMGL